MNIVRLTFLSKTECSRNAFWDVTYNAVWLTLFPTKDSTKANQQWHPKHLKFEHSGPGGEGGKGYPKINKSMKSRITLGEPLESTSHSKHDVATAIATKTNLTLTRPSEIIPVRIQERVSASHRSVQTSGSELC